MLEEMNFSGIERAELLPKLCLEGTDILLLEMPFDQWTGEMAKATGTILTKRGLKVGDDVPVSVRLEFVGIVAEKYFSATSAAILAVEICQLLLRVGSFDVDDYILNILGALILFGILATKAGKKLKARIMDPPNKYSKNRS